VGPLRIWLILAAIALSGCAPAVRTDKAMTDASPYRQTADGVEVVIEPWSDEPHLRSLFRRMPAAPVVGYRITMKNAGTTTIRFSETAAELRAEDGRTLPVISPNEMARRLLDDGSGGAAVAVFVPYIGPIIGGSMMGAASDDGLHDQKQIRQTTMDLVLLDPGQQLTGFLFFDDSIKRLPGRPRAGQMTLTLKRVIRSQGTDLHFEIKAPAI
jgi:hypothetical protein